MHTNKGSSVIWPTVDCGKRTAYKPYPIACAYCVLSVYSSQFQGIPPSKKVAIPSNGCEIVCSKSFFGQDNELQIYHENFLIMDN